MCGVWCVGWCGVVGVVGGWGGRRVGGVVVCGFVGG